MTTIIETFSDFVTAAANYTADTAPRSWRTGQAAYNLLDTVRPDLSFMVAGSDIDPFHDDSRLPLFYDFVMRHW